VTRTYRPAPSNDLWEARYGSPWNADTRDELLHKWLNGDDQAIDFVLRLGEASELWDDLIDKDNEVTDAKIDDAFTFLMAEAPIHPFYLRHAQAVHTLLMLGVNAYRDSETMKARGLCKEDYINAFVLRMMFIELIIFASMVTSGFAKAREYSMQIRDFFYHDNFDDWSGEGDHAD